MSLNFQKYGFLGLKPSKKSIFFKNDEKTTFSTFFDPKNPHFWKFGPTYIDVFFDEKFKNDLIFMIFLVKTVPKVEKTWKKAFFEGVFYKKTLFYPLRGPLFQKNNAIFEFLVKFYVDIGGSEFWKMWVLTYFLGGPKLSP